MMRDNIVNLVYDKLEKGGANFDTDINIHKFFQYDGDMTHPPDYVKDIPNNYSGHGIGYKFYADPYWAKSLEGKVFKFGDQLPLYMLIYRVKIHEWP